MRFDRCPRWRYLALYVLLCCAIGTPCLASTKLRVMGFAGSSDWPIFVAQAQGYFEQRGLDVQLLTTRSSAAQMRALLSGEIDMAMTAMDNVIAADMRDPTARVIAVMGINRGGRARLVAAPEISSIAQLRGRTLAVDAIDTGYAFMLMELLERAGVDRRDYTLLSVGGSPERLAALKTGRAAAALLNAPVDAIAADEGFRVLASTSEVVARYQGSVAAVRETWARDHGDVLVAFIRAYVDALAWLNDPSHRDAAIALLVQRVDGIGEAQAAKSYAELLEVTSGAFSPRAAIDVDGVRAVLDLRARHGPPVDRYDRDLHRYYDPGFHQRALNHE